MLPSRHRWGTWLRPALCTKVVIIRRRLDIECSHMIRSLFVLSFLIGYKSYILCLQHFIMVSRIEPPILKRFLNFWGTLMEQYIIRRNFNRLRRITQIHFAPLILIITFIILLFQHIDE